MQDLNKAIQRFYEPKTAVQLETFDTLFSMAVEECSNNILLIQKIFNTLRGAKKNVDRETCFWRFFTDYVVWFLRNAHILLSSKRKLLFLSIISSKMHLNEIFVISKRYCCRSNRLIDELWHKIHLIH